MGSESAVGADEQQAGLSRLAAGRRWRDLVDGDADAEGTERVVHHAVHRQERARVYAQAREQEPVQDLENRRGRPPVSAGSRVARAYACLSPAQCNLSLHFKPRR